MLHIVQCQKCQQFSLLPWPKTENPCSKFGSGSLYVTTTLYSIVQLHWFGHYFCSNLYGRAPGVPGVSKNQIFFLQMNLLSFFALRLPQKGTNFEKSSKLKKNCQKNPCFPRVFQIFFNLGAILVHQMSNGMFSRSWRIF